MPDVRNLISVSDPPLDEVHTGFILRKTVQRDPVNGAIIAIREPALGIIRRGVLDGIATGHHQHHITADLGGEEVIKEPGGCFRSQLLEGIEEEHDAPLTLLPCGTEGDVRIGQAIQLGHKRSRKVIDGGFQKLYILLYLGCLVFFQQMRGRDLGSLS